MDGACHWELGAQSTTYKAKESAVIYSRTASDSSSLRFNC